MPLSLSLDLSSPHATVALHRDGKLVAERTLGDRYQHTERLLSVLQTLLGENALTLPAITGYYTVSGPGSFTGLRIAMATLKAFAMVSAHPIETLSGAETRGLAWCAEHAPPPGRELIVLTFVSSGKFVVSRFETTAEGLALRSETVETQLAAAADTVVLNDGRVPATLITGGRLSDFLLYARHLAEQAARAKSRRTFANLGEWIAMSPAYFGAQHYE